MQRRSGGAKIRHHNVNRRISLIRNVRRVKGLGLPLLIILVIAMLIGPTDFTQRLLPAIRTWCHGLMFARKTRLFMTSRSLSISTLATNP